MAFAVVGKGITSISLNPDAVVRGLECFHPVAGRLIGTRARNGAAIRDADIYVTHTPCIHCLKVLINTGVRNVYYAKEYKLHTLAEMLVHASIKLTLVPSEDSAAAV